MSITMAHLLEVDIEKTLIFQGITLDIIGRNNSIQSSFGNKATRYGILSGCWDDDDERIMDVQQFVEKPTDDFAKEYLGVKNKKQETKYYATFGQYVLTPEVFEELDRVIKFGKPSEGAEYGLTAVIDTIRKKDGLVGFVPKGKCFDIGLPEEYRKTMIEFVQ